MSNIIQSNNHFTLGEITGTYDTLPVGNYSLQFDERRDEYYLIKQEDFKLPDKIYGDLSFIDRWILSYNNNSEKNLGILLSGIKGTGKTITAQIFAKKINLPIIFITKDFCGPKFETFLSNPCFFNSVIFIDEFEKIYDQYDNDSINSLLGLMDGLFNTKFIFLLTANNPVNINEKLKNRLNRVKYHKIYEKLDINVAEDIINDMLIDKKHKNSLFQFIDSFNMLTMDILTSLIKEINLFGEDAITCASYLNLTDEEEYYSVTIKFNGKKYNCRDKNFSHKDGQIFIEYSDYLDISEIKELLPEYSSIKIFEYEYLKKGDTYVVKYSDNVTIIIERKKYSLFF